MSQAPLDSLPPPGDPLALQQALAQAYMEMVRLHREGETAAAQAVARTVQQHLNGLVERGYQAGNAHLAAGRHDAALGAFSEVIEVHRLNLAGLELSVGLETCFERLRSVYMARNQVWGAAAAARLAVRRGASFYPHPRACQLPVLGGLYEMMFGERTDGTFVEVGAFDGETYSNTSNLADLGWRGVYVEPVANAVADCRKRHARNPKVSVLACAIGAEDGTASLWENGPCSTLSEAEHALNMSQGLVLVPEVRRAEVPVRRLDGVLAETGIAPGFELLVVDVDGWEEAVFAGFDLDRWKPRYLLVELVEDSPHFAGAAELIAVARRVREHVGRHGYAEVYRDPGNTIFRAPD